MKCYIVCRLCVYQTKRGGGKLLIPVSAAKQLWMWLHLKTFCYYNDFQGTENA